MILIGRDKMSDSILRNKSKEFAKQVIFLCRRMRKDNIEFPIINQLLRSGTSIGANIHEAQYAHGDKDFISKMEIALKECNESDYWIELLYETHSITEKDYSYLSEELINLRRMLVATVRTMKEKGKQ